MVQRDKTQVGQTDFAPTISKIESAEPDAIFYGGYIAEAAPLLKQIRDAGIEAPFVGGDGLYGADFGNAVGDAGEGAVVMCPCAPIEEDSTFAADFEEEFGSAPGAYAAEGYDAMSVFLDALDDGARTREEMLAFVNDYRARASARTSPSTRPATFRRSRSPTGPTRTTGGTLTPEVEVKPEG